MSGVAKCPEMDLNHRPIDFQSIASTAELSGLAGFAPFQASLPCQGLSSRSKFPYGGSGAQPPFTVVQCLNSKIHLGHKSQE